MRAGQVTGRAHKRVIVEDVKDAGYRLNDVVLAQFGLGAVARAFAAALAIAEPASPPAPPPVAVVVATRLLAARALLITAPVATAVLFALVCLGVLSALGGLVALVAALSPLRPAAVLA